MSAGCRAARTPWAKEPGSSARITGASVMVVASSRAGQDAGRQVHVLEPLLELLSVAGLGPQELLELLRRQQTLPRSTARAEHRRASGTVVGRSPQQPGPGFARRDEGPLAALAADHHDRPDEQQDGEQ